MGTDEDRLQSLQHSRSFELALFQAKGLASPIRVGSHSTAATGRRRSYSVPVDRPPRSSRTIRMRQQTRCTSCILLHIIENFPMIANVVTSGDAISVVSIDYSRDDGGQEGLTHAAIRALPVDAACHRDPRCLARHTPDIAFAGPATISANEDRRREDPLTSALSSARSRLSARTEFSACAIAGPGLASDDLPYWGPTRSALPTYCQAPSGS